MNQRGLVWVIGHGLLGRAVVRALTDHQLWHWPVRWYADDLDAQLDNATASFHDAIQDETWSVIWCAGAGVIGTSPATLERETASLARVLDGLRSAPPGRLFLASSAGGVHGGSSELPITEATDSAPLADYGRNKLRQEALVAEWCASTGHRAVIGRIANLYGPDQSLAKQQGLISQICLSTLLRRPLSIYVPLDTIRDYVYADDCGRRVVAMLDRLGSEMPGTSVVKIIASGRSISIAGVLAETGRVLRRRPLVGIASSPNRRLQGSTLVFESRVWPDLDATDRTTLPAGIAAVAAALRTSMRAGPLGSLQ